MIGKFFCCIGLHRWEFKSMSTTHTMRDFARCKRPSCIRYPKWMCVNEEEK